MAQQRLSKSIALFGLAMMMIWTGATAQSSDSSCTNVLISLSPCLDYITGNSSTPSSGCCTQLASVVRSAPKCLCQVLNGGGSSLGLSINETQAMTLPAACKIQTPPVSQCKAVTPSGTPTGSANSAPSVPSGSSSKTAPTTEGSSPKGSSNKLSFSALLTVVFMVLYASTINSS